MADFTTSNTTKSAVRKLADPLADVTAFDNIVQGVITNNPFQCVAYNAQGVNHPPVEQSRAGYTARVVYQDGLAKTIALITIRAPTIASFTSVANQIVADTAIATAIGGTPVRDLGNEKYAATLRCHDANGETGEKMVRAALQQFKGHLVHVRTYAHITRPDQLRSWAASPLGCQP